MRLQQRSSAGKLRAIPFSALKRPYQPAVTSTLGGHMRIRTMMFAAACAAASLLASAAAFSQEKMISDAQYTAKALSAAPRAISMHAAVVRMDKDGKMRTLRKG